MSPIIDLQRRLAEVGRIRLGEQVTTRSGKKAPAKLTRFRFTSPSADLIDQAAGLYGGTPRDWQAPSGAQREVVTDTTTIPVLVPPGDMAFSQWLETWSGGGCRKRCDGRWDIQRDQACDCDPENRECKPTTRVSLILPEMPGVGLWRVETHGHYAAVELGATVELLQSLAPGRLVPGRLRLDPRTVKRSGPDGKPQTRNFVVPVLDIEGTMAALGTRETPAAVDAAPPVGLTPVPAAVLEAAPAPSVAAQLEATKTAPRRKNAAAEIPPTGLKPPKMSGGGAVDPPSAVTSPGLPAPDPEAPSLSPEVEPVPDTAGDEVGSAPAGVPSAPGGQDSPPPLKAVNARAYGALNRKCRAIHAEHGAGDKETAGAQWDALAFAVSAGRSVHLGELSPDEATDFRARMIDVSEGRSRWAETDDPQFLGWTLTTVEAS